MGGEELLEAGKGGCGFGEGVKAELEELCVVRGGGGALPQLGRGGGLDGHTKLAQPGPGKGQRRGNCSGVGFRARHTGQLTHLKRE